MKAEPAVITTISDLISVSKLVNQYFNDDEKTTVWLNTANPLLEGQEPIELIFQGRTEKLKKFIKGQFKGNGI